MTNYGTGLKKNHVTLRWHNYCMMPGHTPHPLTHTPRTSLSVCHRSLHLISHSLVSLCDVRVYLRVFLCVCVLCVFVNVCDPRHSSPQITATTCNKHLSWMNDKTKQSACLLQTRSAAGWDRWRIGTTWKHSMMVSIKSQAICRSWQCSPSYVRVE